ncbi:MULTISPECIES: glutamine synthetase family protein [unclassified Sphingobium]|uniref:glutamine synthetase family protein n=1 Tax=unclassified Sphingobium TaxID=2611147 RepID=UPI0022241A80|nr:MULTISPECIES: glutamine synthetase family protein [unclassified Sphingobium]MCW2380480.1 glutamine synthetase [Sphingobium sp. B2D3B]MCW2399413.1 glutamine synthetase [Sphingobium sp. B2D3C]
MSDFIATHGLWSDEARRQAADVLRRVEADGINTVRLVFADMHGITRGKTLLAGSLAGAFEDGCAITSTLLLKDTSHRTVVPVFAAGAGIGDADLQGGGDVIMVPDPATFRVLPWAPGTGWMLCDLYHHDGRPVVASTRRLARAAVDRLAARGFEYVSGLEVEFYLTRLEDAALALGDAGQPGRPPQVSLLHQGYAYLTEQRYDQVEPIVEILRENCLALGLPLHSLEVEFGPSQCEFVFKAGTGIGPADDMILFRSAAKQIARRHGYHVSFMCRPQLPEAMASGWHLHQSLRNIRTGENAFAPSDGSDGLSGVGQQFLAGLLAGAAGAAPFSTPTINGYKRYRPNSLAPDRVAWAEDNRGAMLRVLARGAAKLRRIENRVGEPAANPYLYLASQMVTGLAGIEDGMDLPPPVDSPYAAQVEKLPQTLDAALDRLDTDPLLRAAFGNDFVDHFLLIKRAEVARYNQTVTDWEHREYFDLF